MEFTQVILSVIREFGFPVFVCLWLMRLYMTGKQQTDQILMNLRDIMVQMNRSLGEVQEDVKEGLSGPYREQHHQLPPADGKGVGVHRVPVRREEVKK